MKKRLYRSKENRMLMGICGGIADYFDLDPTVIRLAWVILSCMGGGGLVAYLICTIIIPQQPDYIEQ